MSNSKRLLSVVLLVQVALLLCLVLTPIGKTQQSSVKVFYVVTSVDASNAESKFSNEVSATLSSTHAVAVLSWVASTSTVAGYNVYRGTVTGGPYTKVNTALVSGVTFSDTYPFPAPPTSVVVSVP